jgi:NAD(P)-dependent dehydrogenase (short-subunit alcohol dehydrogenase family)
MRSLQVDAVGPALLMQQLSSQLARGERVIWAKLSARVGSIEDNHKGGWYGYRSAKAALNQLLQTTAIEWARQRPLAVVAASTGHGALSFRVSPLCRSRCHRPTNLGAGLAEGAGPFAIHRPRTVRGLPWTRDCLVNKRRTLSPL